MAGAPLLSSALSRPQGGIRCPGRATLTETQQAVQLSELICKHPQSCALTFQDLGTSLSHLFLILALNPVLQSKKGVF